MKQVKIAAIFAAALIGLISWRSTVPVRYPSSTAPAVQASSDGQRYADECNEGQCPLGTCTGLYTWLGDHLPDSDDKQQLNAANKVMVAANLVEIKRTAQSPDDYATRVGQFLLRAKFMITYFGSYDTATQHRLARICDQQAKAAIRAVRVASDPAGYDQCVARGLERVRQLRVLREDDLGRNVQGFQNQQSFRAFFDNDDNENASEIRRLCRNNPSREYAPEGWDEQVPNIVQHIR